MAQFDPREQFQRLQRSLQNSTKGGFGGGAGGGGGPAGRGIVALIGLGIAGVAISNSLFNGESPNKLVAKMVC